MIYIFTGVLLGKILSGARLDWAPWMEVEQEICINLADLGR
jgi:hypothetical protein